jgi:hypothetical protein
MKRVGSKRLQDLEDNSVGSVKLADRFLGTSTERQRERQRLCPLTERAAAIMSAPRLLDSLHSFSAMVPPAAALLLPGVVATA